MFITLQFPLADSRHFVNSYTGRLGAPPWPLADPARHFVRSVGPVRSRRPGFTDDWPGEDLPCDAKGAVKFAIPGGAQIETSYRIVQLKPAFRRYFAGGNSRWAGAVARIDVGFSVIEKRIQAGNRNEGLSISYFKDIALSCLASPVIVPGQTDGYRELVTVGSALARRMLRATTSTIAPPERTENWWITPGCPLVLIEANYHSSIPEPLAALDRAWKSSLRDTDPIAAHYFLTVRRHGVTVPVWTVLHDPDADRAALRNLRIHLWRLHNEREVLKSILALCLEERLTPAKNDKLRDYLARQSDRLRRSRTEGFIQRDLIDYAYQLDDLINKTDISKLKEIIDTLGPGVTASVMPVVLPNHRKVQLESQPHTLIYLESGNMMIEDKSQRIGTVGSAGAIVGGAAQVSGGSFQGSGTQMAAVAAEADLSKLAEELSILRNELRKLAKDVDQDLAVANVAVAEKAAGEGNRAAVIGALSKAGNWVLSVATQIGTTLAAEVIKASMGIG
jgi:hypothetical protein